MSAVEFDLTAVAVARNQHDATAGVIPRHLQDEALLQRVASLLGPYLRDAEATAAPAEREEALEHAS